MIRETAPTMTIAGQLTPGRRLMGRLTPPRRGPFQGSAPDPGLFLLGSTTSAHSGGMRKIEPLFRLAERARFQ